MQNLRRILFNKSFNLLIKIYSVNLVIQSKYRKIRTRKNSVFWQFSRSVTFSKIYSLLFKQKTYIKNSSWSWNSAETAISSSNFQKKNKYKKSEYKSQINFMKRHQISWKLDEFLKMRPPGWLELKSAYTLFFKRTSKIGP